MNSSLLALRLSAAFLFFLLPGLITIRRTRLTDDPVEYVPFAFAIAITALTIINVPLLLLGANIWSVVAAWTLWIVASSIDLYRRRERHPDSFTLSERMKGRWNVVVYGVGLVAVLALIAFAFFVSGALVTGEEEIEIIITRKLLENPRVFLTNINYLYGFPPTYLLVPLYLFRALLSAVSGLDPIIAHYRSAWIPALLSPLVMYACARALSGSRRIAHAALLMALVNIIFASTSRGEYYASLPFTTGVVYRVPLSFNVLGPLGFVFALRYISASRHRLDLPLAVGVFIATLVTQAVTAAALLVVFATVAMAIWITRWRRLDASPPHAGVRSMRILGVCILITVAYLFVFGVYHPETTAGEAISRAAIRTSLADEFRRDPGALVWGTPAPVTYRYNVLMRVVTFSMFDGQIMSFMVQPRTLLSFALAPLLVLFMGDYRPRVLLLLFIVPVLILRLPILYLPLLLSSNLFVLKNLHALTGFLQFLVPLFVLIGFFHLLLVRLPTRIIPTLSVLALGGFLSWRAYVALDFWGGVLRNFIRSRPDELLIWWLAAIGALAALRRWLKIDWSVVTSAPPTAICAAAIVVLPFVVLDFSGAPGQDNLFMRWAQRRDRLAQGRNDFERYFENTTMDRSDKPTPALFRAVRFTRTLPQQQVFLADPAIIRYIPFIANQYIAHSGVPFDFIEPYFLKYVEEKGDEHGRRTLEYTCAWFSTVDLDPDVRLQRASEMLKEFPIRYILSTPRYRATIEVLMERLKDERQVQWRRVYDDSGYTIYELG